MIEDGPGGMWDKVDINSNSSTDRIKEYLNNGKNAYFAGKDQEAIQELTQCVNDDPDNMEAHYYLGLIYTRLLDFNRAIIHFNEIVMSKYEFLHLNQVHTILAYIYSVQNDFATAKEYLYKSLGQNESDIKSLSIMGYIAYQEKEYDTAIDYYTKIIGLDGENANAYNSLGVIYIESGENIDKGIAVCERALELIPKSAAYLDSIGWGYYKKGDETRAMEYLKQAFELAPDNMDIKEHLKVLLNL